MTSYTAQVFGFSRFAHHYSGNHFVFFSWHYLDVSVHAVRRLILCIQIRMPGVCPGGLPHSDIFGSSLGWQLPEAFSSLPLPSSPPDTCGIHQTLFSIIYKFLRSLSCLIKTRSLFLYPRYIYVYFKDLKSFCHFVFQITHQTWV